MASAKFIIVGETGMWTRARVQEEINAHGLEGSVVDAGDGGLGVFVSGDRMKIRSLYTDLGENLPKDVQPTNLIYGEFKRPKTTEASMAGADAFQTLIELLKEIEKNTRKINQKLDKIIGGRQKTLSETETPVFSETESAREPAKEWSWSQSETKESKDEGGGENATDAFAKMFG